MKIDIFKINNAEAIFRKEAARISKGLGLHFNDVAYLMGEGVQTKDMPKIVAEADKKGVGLGAVLDNLDAEHSIVYLPVYDIASIMRCLEVGESTRYEYPDILKAAAKEEAKLEATKKAKEARKAEIRKRGLAFLETAKTKAELAKAAKEVAQVLAKKAIEKGKIAAIIAKANAELAKAETAKANAELSKAEAERARIEEAKELVAKLVARAEAAKKARRARRARVAAIKARVAAVKAVQAKIAALKAIEDAKEAIEAAKTKLVEVVNAATNDLDNEGYFVEVELAEAKLKAAKAELEAARKAFFRYCPSRQCKDKAKRTELAHSRFNKAVALTEAELKARKAAKSRKAETKPEVKLHFVKEWLRKRKIAAILAKPAIEKNMERIKEHDAPILENIADQSSKLIEQATDAEIADFVIAKERASLEEMKQALTDAGIPCNLMTADRVRFHYKHLNEIDVDNVIPESAKTESIRFINKAVTDAKHSYSMVLRKVRLDADKVDPEVFNKHQLVCKAEAGKMRVLKYFNAQTKNEQHVLVDFDEYGNPKGETFIKTGIKGIVKPGHLPAYDSTANWERYRYIDNDVILLQVKGRKDAAFFDKYVVDGLFCGINENTGEIRLFPDYATLEASGLKFEGYYSHFINSSSSLKVGECLLVRLNCTAEDVVARNGKYKRALMARIKQLFDLTGWALGEVFCALENRRKAQKAGDVEKALLPSKYTKPLGRPGLWYTPQIDVGYFDNIMLICSQLDMVSDFEGCEVDEVDANGIPTGKKIPTEEVMSKFGIDANFADGAAYAEAEATAAMISGITGRPVTAVQAMAFLPQMRVTVINLKGIAQVYNKMMMAVKAENAFKLFEVKAYIRKQSEEMKALGVEAGTYDNASLSKLSFEQREALFRSLQLISSENENKAISFKALDRGVRPEVNIVNAIKQTDTGTSNQSLNKIADVPELFVKAQKMARVMMGDKIKEIAKKVSKLQISEDCKGITSMPVAAAIEAIGTDKAVKDMALMSNKVRNDVNALSSAIGKIKLNYGAHYLAALPADLLLTVDKDTGKYIDILKARDVEWCSPEDMEAAVKAGIVPKTTKVRAYEIYSNEFNKKVVKRIKKLRKSGKYNKEQLALLEQIARCVAVIKYPSQGTNEFVIAYCMSAKEVMSRIDNANISEKAKKAARSAYCKSPEAAVIFGCNNGIKQALAGFDFDGDAVALVPVAFSTDEKDEYTYGLFYSDVDKDGKVVKEVISDYTSLIVQKYIYNGCKYIKTCIIYPEIEKKASRYNSAFFDKLYDEVKELDFVLAEDIEAAAKMEREYFGWKFHSEGFMDQPYVLNTKRKMKDILGLYAAANKCGDDIGLTIVLCSVVIMNINMFRNIGGKMVFNYDLFKTLFSPLGIEKNARGYYSHYSSVFFRKTPASVLPLNEANVETVTDRFGVTSDYHGVTKATIDSWKNKVIHLSKDTTVNEWRQLVADFVHITRALGESSIDVKKDVTKTFYVLARNIINNNVRCLGNVKPEYVDYDNDSLTKESQKEKEFKFSFDRFINKYQRKDKGAILVDPIGILKDMFRQLAGIHITNVKKNILSKADYSYYRRYAGDCYEETLAGKYPTVAEAINNILTYLLMSSVPNKDGKKEKMFVSKISKATKDELRSALYNTARCEGCKASDVVKIAIQVCFRSGAWNKDEKRMMYDFDFSRYYVPKMNTLINFFKEIFVVERYLGVASESPSERFLPALLTLDPDSKLKGIDSGKYNFVRGVCVEHPGLKVMNDLTGTAFYNSDDKSVAYKLYPEKDIVKDKDTFVFAIEGFAGGQFKKMPQDKAAFKRFDMSIAPLPVGLIALQKLSEVNLTVEKINGEEKIFVRANNGMYLAMLKADANGNIAKAIKAKKFVKMNSLIAQGFTKIEENGYDKELDKSKYKVVTNYFLGGNLAF